MKSQESVSKPSSKEKSERILVFVDLTGEQPVLVYDDAEHLRLKAKQSDGLGFKQLA